MNRLTSLTNLALATLAALVVVAPVQAGQEIPFQASGLREHVSIEHVQGGLHVVAAIPEGKSNLGDWYGLADNYIHGNEVIGTMTITYNAGNTLTVAFVQESDPHAGDFGGSVGFFVVTGGTGRFAGATGSGSMDALWTDQQAVNVLIVLDGTIILK